MTSVFRTLLTRMFFTFIVGLIVSFVTWLYFHLRRNRGYVETLGLPLDKPHVVFGSLPLLPHKYVFHEVQMDKFRRFGKTFVGYEYVQPILVTIDPDLIKAVAITHFENFTDVIDFKVSFISYLKDTMNTKKKNSHINRCKELSLKAKIMCRSRGMLHVLFISFGIMDANKCFSDFNPFVDKA